MRWDRIAKTCRSIGLERTRRALALLPLAAFVLMYGAFALLLEPAWKLAFAGLAICYLVGFVALGAEWFWARWYCMGLAWSGVMVGVFGMVNVGLVPPLVIYASMHGAIVVLLNGKSLCALYEGQTAWRNRFELDDHGASRVGKAVSRTSASLPALILWAFGPNQPAHLMGPTSNAFAQCAAMSALVLAVCGLTALVRGRALGALLVVGASCSALLALPLSFFATSSTNQTAISGMFGGAIATASLALVFAMVPMFRPLVNYLRGR